jgi:hypothetical protein
MKFILPDGVLSAIEIFEHVIEVDCYPNISIAYRILFTLTKEAFQTEIIEKLFEINNGSRKVKSFDGIMHREEVIR